MLTLWLASTLFCCLTWWTLNNFRLRSLATLFLPLWWVHSTRDTLDNDCRRPVRPIVGISRRSRRNHGPDCTNSISTECKPIIIPLHWILFHQGAEVFSSLCFTDLEVVHCTRLWRARDVSPSSFAFFPLCSELKYRHLACAHVLRFSWIQKYIHQHPNYIVDLMFKPPEWREVLQVVKNILIRYIFSGKWLLSFTSYKW